MNKKEGENACYRKYSNPERLKTRNIYKTCFKKTLQYIKKNYN